MGRGILLWLLGVPIPVIGALLALGHAANAQKSGYKIQ